MNSVKTGNPKVGESSTVDEATNRLEEIQNRAYQIWLEQNCPEGRALEHWIQAEHDLVSKPPRTQEKSKQKKKANKSVHL